MKDKINYKKVVKSLFITIFMIVLHFDLYFVIHDRIIIRIISRYFKSFLFSFKYILIHDLFFSIIFLYFVIYIFNIFLKYESTESILNYVSIKNFKKELILKYFIIILFIHGLFILFQLYFGLVKRNITDLNNFVFNTFNIIFISPIFEEIIYRGYLYNSLKKSNLARLYVYLLINALFSMAHIQYYFNYQSLVYYSILFIYGLIFTHAREKSKSICISILLHSLINISSTIVYVATYNFK
jgi:uncharacterized protein